MEREIAGAGIAAGTGSEAVVVRRLRGPREPVEGFSGSYILGLREQVAASLPLRSKRGRSPIARCLRGSCPPEESGDVHCCRAGKQHQQAIHPNPSPSQERMLLSHKEWLRSNKVVLTLEKSLGIFHLEYSQRLVSNLFLRLASPQIGVFGI